MRIIPSLGDGCEPFFLQTQLGTGLPQAGQMRPESVEYTSRDELILISIFFSFSG